MKNINQKTLAKAARIGEPTLRRWRKLCGMPFYKHSDDEVCFDPEETLKFLAREKPMYVTSFEIAFKRLGQE